MKVEHLDRYRIGAACPGEREREFSAAKKSAQSPPMIGAMAPQVAVTTLLAARKAVACPAGDSFMTMLPEARATPAVATPISTWMATSR